MRSNSSGMTTFVVQSPFQGWVGIGIGGKTMAGPDLFVAWNNNVTTTKQPAVVSQHKAAAWGYPPLATIVSNFSVRAVLPPSVSRFKDTGNGATLAIFRVPVDLATAAKGFVYAVSNSYPTVPTVATTMFAYHDSRGNFSLDLTSVIPALPPPVSTVPALVSAVPPATAPVLPVLVRQFCTPDGIFCVTALRDAAAPSFISLTVESVFGGWLGVALGPNMSGATHYVGWESSVGTMLVTQRSSTTWMVPIISPNPSFSLTDLPPGVTPRSNSSLVFTVRRPVKGYGIVEVSETGPTGFLVAGSSVAPIFRDAPNAMFSRHESRVMFTLDMTFSVDVWKAIGSTATSTVTPTPTPAAVSTTTPTAAAVLGDAYVLSNVSFDTFANADVAVAIIRSSGTGMATVVVQTSFTGWVGIGIGGTTMAGPDLYVGWVNNATSTGMPAIMSQHKAPAWGYPPLTAQSKFKVLANIPVSVNTLLSTAGGAIAMAFQVPLDLATAAKGFIYAVSNSVPVTPANASSSFAYHDSRGTFNLSLTTTRSFLPPPVTILPATVSAISSTNASALPVLVRQTCTPDGFFCVTVIRDAASPYFITITAESTLGGWLGVGLGPNMTGATYYLGWETSVGTLLVTQRSSSMHMVPIIDSSPQFDRSRLPSGVVTRTNSSIVFTVRRPVKGDGIVPVSETGPTSFLVAGSSLPPLFRDAPDAKFARHESRSILSLDLTFSANCLGGHQCCKLN
ncbi:hypothetical protein DFJ73DRAFT_368575 [Zopfochytrium polystomum]|nr:hypothetical protein DFJ73DRAFT_368575 [Zopfochytrium polystomum]